MKRSPAPKSQPDRQEQVHVFRLSLLNFADNVWQEIGGEENRQKKFKLFYENALNTAWIKDIHATLLLTLESSDSKIQINFLDQLKSEMEKASIKAFLAAEKAFEKIAMAYIGNEANMHEDEVWNRIINELEPIFTTVTTGCCDVYKIMVNISKDADTLLQKVRLEGDAMLKRCDAIIEDTRLQAKKLRTKQD